MLTRDEALAKIRTSLTNAGVPDAGLDGILADVPDDVIEAVMDGAEPDPVVVKADTLTELAAALARRMEHYKLPGHIPGCDGQHDLGDEVKSGVILMDDPDAENHMGTHGLANVANLIKTVLTYVATEDHRNFQRWLRERELKGEVEEHYSGKGQFADQVTPSMLAWIGLTIKNSHADCPPGEHGGGGGGVPDAFRKQKDDVIIDPSQFRYF